MPVPRSRGIPQGLPVSPVIANLFMVEFDHWVSRKLRRLGAVVRRYADDVAIFAPSMRAATDARAIVFGHIQRLGLQVKNGTGEIVDLVHPDLPLPNPGLHPGVPVVDHVLDTGGDLAWAPVHHRRFLGGDQRALHVDVDPRKVGRKTVEIQAEFDKGLLSAEGVQQRLQELRNFYRMTLSESTALRVVDRIKEGLHALAQVGSLGGDGGADRKGKEKEEVQDECSGMIDPRERRTGGQNPVGRLSEVVRPRANSGNRDRRNKGLLHRPKGSGGMARIGVSGMG